MPVAQRSRDQAAGHYHDHLNLATMECDPGSIPGLRVDPGTALGENGPDNAMMTRRQAALALGAAATTFAGEKDTAQRIRLHRIPSGGIQPQVALDDKGTLHLVYYIGDGHRGSLFYVRSKDGGESFSSALPVNRGGSAIAAGTIRGSQLALGKTGRVHVAWNGSNNVGPLNPDSGTRGAPMLYTRLNGTGRAFEPERNLMHHSFGLDGGGTIAADRSGNVYVMWHGIGDSEAKGSGKEGEARRRVWVTKSEDDGQTFSSETAAWAQETGACGCCGMKAFAETGRATFLRSTDQRQNPCTGTSISFPQLTAGGRLQGSSFTSGTSMPVR